MRQILRFLPGADGATPELCRRTTYSLNKR